MYYPYEEHTALLVEAILQEAECYHKAWSHARKDTRARIAQNRHLAAIKDCQGSVEICSGTGVYTC